MAEITGTSPNGRLPRVVEIVRRGLLASIWIHRPDSDETDGLAIWVGLDELREMLAAEDISNQDNGLHTANV